MTIDNETDENVIEDVENEDLNQEELDEQTEEVETDGETEDDPEKQAEEEKPEKTFTQDDVNSIVEKRLGREKKAIADLEAEKEALLKKYEPSDAEIVLPEEPDVYDQDYDEKKKVYDELHLKKEVALAEQRVYEKIQIEHQQAEYQAKLSAEGDAFRANAMKLGITEKEFLAIDDKFVGNPLPAHIAKYITTEKPGILVAKYLTENPSEIEKLQKMSVPQSILYLDKEIKTKAKGNKKPPANTTTGDKSSGSIGGKSDGDGGHFY